MFSNILFLVIFYMFCSILGNFHILKNSQIKQNVWGKKIIQYFNGAAFGTKRIHNVPAFDSANSLVVDPYEEVCLEDMSWIKM